MPVASRRPTFHVNVGVRERRHSVPKFRAILGAANWPVGSTRRDLAATNALLQHRLSRATLADLIEANRMVGLMRDFAKTKQVFKSIPCYQEPFFWPLMGHGPTLRTSGVKRLT